MLFGISEPSTVSHNLKVSQFLQVKLCNESQASFDNHDGKRNHEPCKASKRSTAKGGVHDSS